MTNELRSENGNRKDRMHNIAIAVLKISIDHKGARTKTLREYIRQQLALPKINGEDLKGDLRAHGDALGGHGLHLDVERRRIKGKTERVIMFTDKNVKKCQEFLEKEIADDEENIF